MSNNDTGPVTGEDWLQLLYSQIPETAKVNPKLKGAQWETLMAFVEKSLRRNEALFKYAMPLLLKQFRDYDMPEIYRSKVCDVMYAVRCTLYPGQHDFTGTMRLEEEINAMEKGPQTGEDTQ